MADRSILLENEQQPAVDNTRPPTLAVSPPSSSQAVPRPIQPGIRYGNLVQPLQRPAQTHTSRRAVSVQRPLRVTASFTPEMETAFRKIARTVTTYSLVTILFVVPAPFGIPALVYAIKALKCYRIDYAKAEKHLKTSRYWACAAVCIFGPICLNFITMV
ncbi:uncharacterized protein [Apostichopus japonicus]|uniref:uncharacterized protein n=1 Tax=Stichopus japonicus TaxID=307972 RepID=UPI003AB1C79F